MQNVKFKAGDRVKVIATAEQCESYFAPSAASGREGVVSYDDDITVDVRFEERLEGYREWNFNPEHLELIESAVTKTFAVGDHVKVIKTNNGAPAETLGQEGFIIEQVGNSFAVQFAREFDGSDYWYYSPKRLELIESADDAEAVVAEEVPGHV